MIVSREKCNFSIHFLDERAWRGEEGGGRGIGSLNLKMVEKAWIAVSLYPSSSSRFRKHLKKDPSLIIKDPRTTENNRSERKELPKESPLESTPIFLFFSND